MLAGVAVTAPLAAQPEILFIRGADRSGGFFEFNPGDPESELTEQLADINNTQTFGGNHGWGSLAARLRGEGYIVTQITESVEPGSTSGQSNGVAVPFETMDLSRYATIVFGSNNAAYGPAAVTAVTNYLRNGGGAVFISDANFGSNWGDASDSDQHFLTPLGLTMNQDNGTYTLRRDQGHFVVPDHPLLEGVNRFDGEGVTPVTVNATLPDDVTVEILARPLSNVTRNNNPNGNRRGTTTAPTLSDAVLLSGTIGNGRFVVHFDRNTFFNQGGAGTTLFNNDNATLASNIFAFTTVPEPATAVLALACGGLLQLRRRRCVLV